MSPLDLQLINRKIKHIEVDLDELKKYATVTEAQYLESLEIQLPVERLLERIIGRLTGINYHILKEKYGHLPQDYFDSFIAMGEKGEVESSLAQELAKSTGLRNVLAHEYDTVDSREVYKSITVTLTQVPHYLRLLLTSLQK